MPDIGVETPDGGIAYFPEGTHPDRIRDALRAKFGGGPAKGVASQMSSYEKFKAISEKSGGPDVMAKAIKESVGQMGEHSFTGAIAGTLGLVGAPVTAATELASKATGGFLRPEDIQKPLMALAPSNAAKAVTPVRSAVKSLAQSGYESLESSGVTFKKESVDNLAASIRSTLEKERHRDFNQPATFRNVEQLSKFESNPGINDIDSVRKALGGVAADNRGTEEGRAASRAVSLIDDFLNKVSESDIASGDAKKAVKTLRSAQGEYAISKRTELLEKQFAKAQNQSKKNRYGNLDQTIRDKFNTIVTAIEDGKLKLPKDEESAVRAVVKGGNIRNALRRLGVFSPTGVIPGLAEGAAILHGDMGIGAGVAATGFASKKTAEILAKRAVKEAIETVLSKSSLATKAKPATSQLEIFRGSLFGRGLE